MSNHDTVLDNRNISIIFEYSDKCYNIVSQEIDCVFLERVAAML